MKQWFLQNRRWIGLGLLSVFTYLQANPLTDGRWYSITVGLVSAFLYGAGVTKSDSYFKDRAQQ